MNMEFRVLDLFCGAGGLSWGLHKNKNFKTVVALDFDKNAANTFKKKYARSRSNSWRHYRK